MGSSSGTPGAKLGQLWLWLLTGNCFGRSLYHLWRGAKVVGQFFYQPLCQIGPVG